MDLIGLDGARKGIKRLCVVEIGFDGRNGLESEVKRIATARVWIEMRIAKNDDKGIRNSYEVAGGGDRAKERRGWNGHITAGHNDGGVQRKLRERRSILPTGR